MEKQLKYLLITLLITGLFIGVAYGSPIITVIGS